MNLISSVVSWIAIAGVFVVVWVILRRERILSALAIVGIAGILLSNRYLWHLGRPHLDTVLPILSDFVPIAMALVGIIMSYKQPKRESHLWTTVILLSACFIGTGILSWTRIRNEAAHKKEVETLSNKVDAVGTQNSSILGQIV